MKTIYLIILFLFIFSLAFSSVLAGEKKLDVSVLVVSNNSSIDSSGSSSSSGTIDYNTNSGVNNDSSVSFNSEVNQGRINQSFNEEISEMFSFKSDSSIILPLIFLIIIVLGLIIYEIMHFSKKKKTKRVRRKVGHKK